MILIFNKHGSLIDDFSYDDVTNFPKIIPDLDTS